MRPSLDVVVPTLNASPSLARTIAAVRAAENRLDLAITVCDGGSSDDTVAIARRAGAAVTTAPPGRGAQLAAGAASGRAPWLLFLHADTVPGPGWVDAVLDFVATPANRRKAGYFHLRFDTPDGRARRVERWAAWRCRTFGLPYGDQGLLMARAFHDSLGGFRALPLMEDVDMARRIGRPNLVALDADATTSARRYEQDGWLRRPMRNLACLALFLAGLSPRVVARLYGR